MQSDNDSAGKPPNPDSPGVKLPPPLVYVVGFVAGVLLRRALPLGIADSPASTGGRLVYYLGVLLMAIWALLNVTGWLALRRGRTTIRPDRPARALVVSGPYGLSRNPLYLSLAVLYVGGALIMNDWWPLVFLPFVLVFIDRAVIAREERYLTRAFPEEYAAYCGRVRRWM